jgi:hypothetical protein
VWEREREGEAEIGSSLISFLSPLLSFHFPMHPGLHPLERRGEREGVVYNP